MKKIQILVPSILILVCRILNNSYMLLHFKEDKVLVEKKNQILKVLFKIKKKV